ncbi:MAG: glycosyltransferase family 4 protein [Phycisphaerales bacterium]|nr:glycosyltransferase family 4 protein [Phycisphaerales bacterium]
MPDKNCASLPQVVILNQYYAPDVASTGQLLHELAVELAEHGFNVKVLTARPSYGPPETWKPVEWNEEADGVNIKRLWTTRFSKDNMIGRGLNILTFVLPLTIRVLLTSRAADVHLYTTNPPFLGSVGMIVSRIRKHRYVLLLHDAHPQVGVWTGKIKSGSMVERVWMWLNRKTYRHADQSIVLCEAAKKLVVDTYHVDPARVHVIPNWADEQTLKPLPKAQQPFARDHKLIEPFVLMYSGNLGLYYEFETMLAAAERLKGENFKMVLIGSGGRKPWIAEQIKARNLTNTVLLPYQPIEKLHESLNSCDCSGVTIAKGIEGISFPSKLYSSLAVGKPIVAISESTSELRDLVEQHGVGRWCELGDVDGLVRIIKEMMADLEACKRQGAAARVLFEHRYTRPISCGKYADVLKLAAVGDKPAPYPAQTPTTA